jgi:hypothetical protein
VGAQADLLNRLQLAHEAVLRNLALMEAATAGDHPDPASYAAVRLRLSQASRQRRSAFAQLCESWKNLSARERAIADDLILDERRLTAQSSAHVRTWTREAIQADWEGYRNASAQIRSAMRDRIAREQILLFPRWMARADTSGPGPGK